MPLKRLRLRPHRNRDRQLLPFGPAPLLAGEDSAAYNELLLQVSSAVKPADVLEEIWVRDITDLEWDVLRLRRLKASILNLETRQGLVTSLDRLVENEDKDERGEDADEDGAGGAEEDDGISDNEQLVIAWSKRSPNAVKQVGALLAAQALSIDEIIAEALSDKIDSIERIDRMITMAEARRNTMIREIDRHRQAFGASLGRAVKQIEGDE